jgi:hypothetical protein
VVEEEAERQAREVETARGRYNELMTLGYERAVEWVEDAQRSDIRSQDVIQIIRLYRRRWPTSSRSRCLSRPRVSGR